MLYDGELISWWRRMWSGLRSRTSLGMFAYDRSRRRKQILAAGFATGGLIALAIASLSPPGGGPPGPPSTVLATAAEPAPVSPAGTLVASTEPVVPESPPPPEPLNSNEVRELQSRLHGFGFSPGPIDGSSGRLTTTAVKRYQESRNLPQTGAADREILDMLRTDAAPQVAPPAPPPRPRHTTTASRSQNPFDRLGRWIDSLVR
jgi:hypothetical protein